MSKKKQAYSTRTRILGGLTHEHKALSVGYNLGGVESLFEVIDKLFLVAVEGLFLGGIDD